MRQQECVFRRALSRASWVNIVACNCMMASFQADLKEVKEREEIYERLCSEHPLSVGKMLSSTERDSKGISNSTLVYGEILFEPFAITFQKIRRLYGGLLKAGGVFVDVGSGTGKPVFAACLMHAFTQARGIEILEGLHKASLDLHDRWRSPAVQSVLPVGHGAVDITFQCGNATKTFDWSDADVVFMNSTCFSEQLMLTLCETADRMQLGSWAITFTRKLPSINWQTMDSTVYTMSWGVATVFIQKKIR